MWRAFKCGFDALQKLLEQKGIVVSNKEVDKEHEVLLEKGFSGYFRAFDFVTHEMLTEAGKLRSQIKTQRVN